MGEFDSLVAGEGLTRMLRIRRSAPPLSVGLTTRLLERPPDVLPSRRGLCRFKSSRQFMESKDGGFRHRH